MIVFFQLKITGTFDMTSVHIQALKQNCIEHVEYHQPIPPEVVQKATEPLPAHWFNETETENTNNETVEATITTASEASSTDSVASETNFFTEEFLRNLGEIGCPFDCYGNGECVNSEYFSVYPLKQNCSTSQCVIRKRKKI